MKKFALTGAAGYIAPRHLKAIKETGGKLVAAVDPHDSVGILDSYFPEASFFTEFERFDRHLEMLRRSSGEDKIDYISICSPNYLHDAHIRLALRLGADAICEKPLVINPWNLDALQKLESETGSRVYTVLQLRLHPSLLELKKKISASSNGKKYNVILTYITSRGTWYNHSWKGNIEKSGGLATNIGIHFFDLLLWLFGDLQKSVVHINDAKRAAGFLELQNAYVQWFLSIDRNDLFHPGNSEFNHSIIPSFQASRNTTASTFRSIVVDGEEVQFSAGFTDLHTEVYRKTLEGKGFGIEDARGSIELVHSIRNAKISANGAVMHPLAAEVRGGKAEVLFEQNESNSS